MTSKYHQLNEELSTSSTSLLSQKKEENQITEDEEAIIEKLSLVVEKNDESHEENKTLTTPFYSRCTTCLKKITSKFHKSKNSFETPLPMGKVISLMLSLISGAIVSTMLFSFVGFMVEDFNIAETKEEIGYYAGYIASAYFLGQFLSGWFWGYLADLKGRRPVLIFGIVSNLISMVIFGFSTNLTMSIVVRGLGGLGSANFAIAKSYMNDITDESNRARGFSYLSMSWSLGSIVGPIIGGYCSRISTKIPAFQNTIFETFPYALPSLIGGVVNLISLILAIKFLSESKNFHQPEPEILELEVLKSPNIENKEENKEENVDQDQVHDSIVNGNSSTSVIESITPPKENFYKRHKPVILAMVLYMIIAFTYAIWDEISPLWLLADINAGGLGFDSNQIGTTLTISGFYLVFFQTLFYHRIANKLGPLNTLRLGCLFASIGFLCLPYLDQVANEKGTLWPLLIILLLIRSTGGTIHFTSVNLLINITSPKHAGKANGIAFTLSGLVRTFGPFCGASLFAWSVSRSDPTFPLNQHFVFILMTLLLVILFIISFTLPKIPSTKKP